MRYDKKTVRSRPGLSQEDALTSLQDHPLYRPGTKIASIRRRGDRWVAELLEPKTAGELEDEDGDEGLGEESAPKKPKKPAFADDGGGDEDGDSDDGPEGLDGPPSPDGGPDGPPGKGGEKAEVAQLLHLVQQICDALGIAGSPDAGMGGPDDLGPGPGGPGGPPAPPHGGPPGAGGPDAGLGGPPGGPQEIHHKTKLGPGEVPPGGTPMGAPAFSHVHHGTGMGPSSVSVPVPSAPSPSPQGAQGCPHGYPDAASCPQCQAQGGIGSGAPAPGPVVGRARSFVASKRTNITLKQAATALSAEFGPKGYYVAQIKRDDNDPSIVRAMLVANGR